MGNEWRIIQRRGQLRIYMKDERNRERGIKKEQGKGGEEPSKMSDEQFKKLETTLREEKKMVDNQRSENTHKGKI